MKMKLVLRFIILIIFIASITVYFVKGNDDLFKILIFTLLAITITYSINNRKERDKDEPKI